MTFKRLSSKTLRHGSRQCGANAANAMWRVAHGFDELHCLRAALNHRHKNRLYANIKNLHQHPCFANRYTCNNVRRRRRKRLEPRCQKRNVIGRVLAVQQQPIEARTVCNLGRASISQRQPEADLRLTRFKAALN